MGDCAADVRAIVEALGIERLAVWGISGGGPHAIACAALLSDLVPAVAVLASCAPWKAAGLDYFAGMGQLNVEDIGRVLEDPVAARAKCERDRLEMLAVTPDELIEYLQTVLTPVDAEALTGELVQHLVDAGRLGLEPGGWWDDEVAFLEPWGFELESIRTPVLLRMGSRTVSFRLRTANGSRGNPWRSSRVQ